MKSIIFSAIVFLSACGTAPTGTTSNPEQQTQNADAVPFSCWWKADAICYDYLSGFTEGDVRGVCNQGISGGSEVGTYQEHGCKTENRIGRCTQTVSHNGRTLVQRINSYGGMTVDQMRDNCEKSLKGTFEPN